MGTLGTVILVAHLICATAFSMKFLLALPYVYPRRLKRMVAMGKADAKVLAGSQAGQVFSGLIAWVIITVLGLFGAYAVNLKGSGYKRFFFAYSRKEMDTIVEMMSQTARSP